MSRRASVKLMKRAGSALLALLLLLSLISRPALAEEPPATSLEGAVSTESSSAGSEETTAAADSTEATTTVPEETTAAETSPEVTTAEETTPEETTPEATTPEETTPVETTPEETTPEETTAPPDPFPDAPYTVPYRSFPVDTVAAPVKLALTTINAPLELRTGPAKTYTQLAWVRRGVVLEVKGEENGWFLVSTGYTVNGREIVGYVSGKYVRTQTIAPGAGAYKNYLTFLGFPESYQSQLIALHKQYPNWVFVANQTGESWATASSKESNHEDDYPGISLIHPESKSSWKKSGGIYYDYETSTYEKFDGTWNAASDELVAYFLDPRNFLNSTDIFQFLDQSYDPYQTVDAVQRIVAGTFMASPVTDVDGTSFTYASALVRIGKSLGISPLYLAAVIKQEIGYADNPSINGKSTKYPGYYNYYNIYAYTTANESANDHGLWYASGSGSGQTSYGRPWNTRLRSLEGGAEYLYKNYVASGQHTLYFKKYNVSCNATNTHFRHQFMTNVMGAYSEGRHLANGFNAELRQLSLVFDIPIYSGLPAQPAPCPTGDGCINNRLKSITVGDYELFPEFDKDTLYYNIIIAGEVPVSVTLSAEAYHSSAKIAGTGTVTLKNGSTEYPITVTAENGDVRVYTVSIYCAGGATGLNPKYTIISGNRITGLSFGTKTDAFITNMGLGTGMKASLFNADGSEKAGGDVMKNGDTVKITDADGKMVLQGAVLLFGDVNGDGILRMSDMIKVRNHILGTGTLEGINLAAADCNHDGNIRMSDMIKIRNEILGTGTIVQTGQ